MKIFLIFIAIDAFLLLSVSATDAEDFIKLQKESIRCKMEIGIEDDVIRRALDGEFIDDPKLDCFMGCIIRGLGMFNADGSFNADLAISKIPSDAEYHDAGVTVVRTCSARKAEDDCSTAHVLYLCIHEYKLPQLMG